MCAGKVQSAAKHVWNFGVPCCSPFILHTVSDHTLHAVIAKLYTVTFWAFVPINNVQNRQNVADLDVFYNLRTLNKHGECLISDANGGVWIQSRTDVSVTFIFVCFAVHVI